MSELMYLALAVVAALVLWFIVGFARSASPRGFARGVANAQLNSFLRLQKRYPEADREMLYKGALMLRPGYNEETVDGIIASAQELCDQVGIQLNLQSVVVMLVAHEYFERVGYSFNPPLNEMNEVVFSVIPPNL